MGSINELVAAEPQSIFNAENNSFKYLHTFETVPGLFIQGDPSTDPEAVGALPPHFGLIDNSADRWSKFIDNVTSLQDHADSNVKYKVVFLGRHGQGFHNLAEAKYGTPAWDRHWARLNGDGNITWGPDPLLTPLGVAQAEAVNALWKAELPQSIPRPQGLYSSPLNRAASTAIISFKGTSILAESVSVADSMAKKGLIWENIREVNGVHTCDKRNIKSIILNTYGASFDIEPGFTEKDELWTPDVRESDAHVQLRARDVLDRIFTDDKGTYVSITAHGGFIQATLAVIGHREYNIPTGGVIPILIKATRVQ